MKRKAAVEKQHWGPIVAAIVIGGVWLVVPAAQQEVFFEDQERKLTILQHFFIHATVTVKAAISLVVAAVALGAYFVMRKK